MRNLGVRGARSRRNPDTAIFIDSTSLMRRMSRFVRRRLASSQVKCGKYDVCASFLAILYLFLSIYQLDGKFANFAAHVVALSAESASSSQGTRAEFRRRAVPAR
jgi:hypothetical protein